MSTPFPYTVLAVGGHSADGEPMSVIASEWPQRWKPLDDKQAKERQHLERFRHDIRVDARSGPYSEVEQIPAGEDPPDFAATFEGQRIGVECSQLTLQSRIEIDAAFQTFARLVMAEDRNSFRHLHHRAVLVFFEGDRSVPNTAKKAKVAITALKNYRPAGTPITKPEPGDQLPAGTINHFTGGTITSAPMQQPSDTPFFRQMNFELALSHSTRIRNDDAWALLERRIADHDQAGVDHLLLSASATTVSGFAFPSDSILLDRILDGAVTRSVQATHITKVILHDWTQSQAWVLKPGVAGVERP